MEWRKDPVHERTLEVRTEVVNGRARQASIPHPPKKKREARPHLGSRAAKDSAVRLGCVLTVPYSVPTTGTSLKSPEIAERPVLLSSRALTHLHENGATTVRVEKTFKVHSYDSVELIEPALHDADGNS